MKHSPRAFHSMTWRRWPLHRCLSARATANTASPRLTAALGANHALFPVFFTASSQQDSRSSPVRAPGQDEAHTRPCKALNHATAVRYIPGNEIHRPRGPHVHSAYFPPRHSECWNMKCDLPVFQESGRGVRGPTGSIRYHDSAYAVDPSRL